MGDSLEVSAYKLRHLKRIQTNKKIRLEAINLKKKKQKTEKWYVKDTLKINNCKWGKLI